jgi:hypothetical protein
MLGERFGHSYGIFEKGARPSGKNRKIDLVVKEC